MQHTLQPTPTNLPSAALTKLVELTPESQHEVLNLIESLHAKRSNRRHEAVEAEDPLLALPSLAVETGIDDLATNVDHYLYGHPKVDRAS